MRSNPTRMAMLGLLLALTPAARLAGQETRPDTFRKGQWGTDFFVGGGFSGAGVVRFRSPTRAWVFDLSGGITSLRDSSNSQALTMTRYGLSARFGPRRYHAIAPHLYRTVTFGVSGSYNHDKDELNTSTFRVTNLGAGLFADLGAQWMVTPHLSLGATWGARADYTHRSSSQAVGGNDTTGHTLSLSFGAVGLRGALYF